MKLLGLAAAFSNKLLTGDVRDTSVRLQKRNDYRNPFQPILSADLEHYNNGTLISCRIGLAAITKIWLTMLLFAVIVLTSCLTFHTLTALARGVNWSRIVSGLLVAGSSVFFCVYGFKLAQGEHEYLINYIQRRLNARRIEI